MSQTHRLLLDTHTLLWYHTQSEDLPKPTARLIADRANEVYVSAATAWEIGIKYRKGRLPEGKPFVEGWHELLAAYQFAPLPITDHHALGASSLPSDHQDPFDRILAAQSQLEQLELVSLDAVMDGFGVERTWID